VFGRIIATYSFDTAAVVLCCAWDELADCGKESPGCRLKYASEMLANQVWSTDIIYSPMRGGFLYLVAVMDWFSRFVLSRDW
jgi:hypothetical protein